MKNRWILFLATWIPLLGYAYNDTIVRHYTDTIMSVTQVPDSTLQQREVVLHADSTDRRGHYVEAHVGLGFGSLGYNLRDAYSKTHGSFSGLLQAQYAYFFTPNWGIGAGLWFTNYTTFAHWGGTFIWKGQTDTDLEQNYDHRANVKRWKERETTHNIGIPISVQFQYRKEYWQARLFAALGLAPSFAVSKKYRVLDGEIAHSGYYPNWNLLLTDVHEFGSKQYNYTGEMSVRPQVAIFADLGALFSLTQQIDLFLGGYFNCALNDANSSAKKDLGWKDATFTFMDTYDGAYATNLSGTSHPWEVGVKVGIHWHYIAPDKHETEEYFDYFTRPDTTYAYVPRTDTTIVVHPDPVPQTIEEVAQEVEKFNKIYFSLASYRLTNKAKSYLSSIVDALNNVPDAKISIDGHASAEGDKDFNEMLAYNRAKAVADYLIRQGLDKDRVIVLGHGSLIPNDELEGENLKRDRRVEVKVITNNK